MDVKSNTSVMRNTITIETTVLNATIEEASFSSFLYLRAYIPETVEGIALMINTASR
jgi:hypothetical protein